MFALDFCRHLWAAFRFLSFLHLDWDWGWEVLGMAAGVEEVMVLSRGMGSSEL